MKHVQRANHKKRRTEKASADAQRNSEKANAAYIQAKQAFSDATAQAAQAAREKASYEELDELDLGYICLQELPEMSYWTPDATDILNADLTTYDTFAQF